MCRWDLQQGRARQEQLQAGETSLARLPAWTPIKTALGEARPGYLPKRPAAREIGIWIRPGRLIGEGL